MPRNPLEHKKRGRQSNGGGTGAARGGRPGRRRARTRGAPRPAFERVRKGAITKSTLQGGIAYAIKLSGDLAFGRPLSPTKP